ncbi:MAG TPA: FAD-dependent oxidoreductase, partial [Chloroflexota bacterium]
MAGRNGHESKRVGAVLVVGGGIGGMQASLDLAESGLKVYMVEAADSIGGKMAMLDKTFPTNDCAMCTISPKLVECGRHLNIDIITGATVEKLEGEPGNFTATIRQKPRYVDLDKCTGCGECALHCPVKVPDKFNLGMNDRRAIYKLYPQAVPNAFAIDKKGRAPCKDACPVSQSAQGYVALVREQRYDDAFRVIKDRNPFPGICGRICNHRCEDNCNRAQYDEAVSIAGLKRFVADRYYSTEHERPARVERTRGEQVAVVGSGPAGLTAAQDLARMGYGVTIFEALPVAGGMMRVGIPSYRLPRELIEREVSDIVDLGVDLKLNARVDNLDDLFAQGFKSVFLAVGAHGGRKLPIPGADHPNVLLNTSFLRETALGNPPKLGKKVLVIGGGNVAMDCARTARRLGQPEVHLACLESREKMPAHEYEIADAEEEGVVVHPARSFKSVEVQDGKIVGVKCDRVDFRGFDKEGRLDMDVLPGTEHLLDCDTIIFAIGQGPELEAFTAAGLETTRRRTLVADPDTLATGRPGVFAGGDAVTGTTFVVDAIAAGHRAAASIDRYLRDAVILNASEGSGPLETEGRSWKLDPSASPQDDRLGAGAPPIVRLDRDEVLRKVESGEAALVARHSIPKIAVAERFSGDSFAEVDLGFSEEAALEEANRCLSCGVCSECLECERACQAGAINHADTEKLRELPVGAVVLAAGYQLYDARLSAEYGLGRFPNVMTNMQFERLLSASGPTTGEVVRPSDHAHPKRIAFLQCVGSRDQNHEYCSSICCMSAAKEAMLAKEHVPDADVRIFMMDVRAFSKGYTAYYERASRMYGVGFTRCRISSLKENPANNNLLVRYHDESGQIVTEEFDMVVLSAGMETSPEAKRLAESVGVELTPQGFCQVAPFKPLETSREGVFVCGPFAEPKDIPETVVEASGAAAKAMALLSGVRGTEVRKKEYPSERDVTGEDPRVGVFICHCGSNIAGVVDVEGVVQYAKKLPNVVHAERNLYTCSEDTQRNIAAKIRDLGLNRVIVASCTPRTHEPLFQETLREAGINPYLFEMANIRDQDSWVHRDDKPSASTKARDLVRMAVGRAALLEPLQKETLGVKAKALVLGAGVAGMTAALAIADQGFDVALVEKKGELGGNMRRLRFSTLGKDPQAFLNSMIARVESHDQIQVFKNAQVVRHSGFVGNFKTVVKIDDPGAEGSDGSDALSRLLSEIGISGGEVEIEHGVTVIATGAQESRSGDYMLGQSDRVVTQLDLEARLAERPQEIQKLGNVAMIQCVGAQNQEYCSRVCCTQALKNAITVKELNPAAQVSVFFKDMRTFGFKEQVYKEAREKGVLFVRYDDGTKPQVSEEGGRLLLKAVDPILGEPVEISPDMLVLSEAIAPGESNQELGTMFKLALSMEGFFLEAHVKLRPVDFPSEGVFLCGLAHYPKFVEESMAQAYAAAARAATVLTKEELKVGGVVAHVDESKCVA